MQLHEFSQGVAVFLSAGSPPMSVVFVEQASSLAWCKSSDVDGKSVHMILPLEQLTHSPPVILAKPEPTEEEKAAADAALERLKKADEAPVLPPEEAAIEKLPESDVAPVEVTTGIESAAVELKQESEPTNG